MSEKELQELVVGLARWAGYLVHHETDSRKSPAGFPDLVLVHRHTHDLILAELKTDKGRVSPKQQEWLDALSDAAYLWRPADWQSGEIQRVLMAGAGKVATWTAR